LDLLQWAAALLGASATSTLEFSLRAIARMPRRLRFENRGVHQGSDSRLDTQWVDELGVGSRTLRNMLTLLYSIHEIDFTVVISQGPSRFFIISIQIILWSVPGVLISKL
jgi:hypothetical protein